MNEDEGARQRSPEPERASDDAMIDDAPPKTAAKPAREKESLIICSDDARFLIGSGGSTKRKLMRVSGADIEISPIEGDPDGNQKLEIISNDETARRRARDCCEWVLQQRAGKIVVDVSTPRDDLTFIDIDPSCQAYITGKLGSGLRRMEEEYGTLMFFARRSTDPEDATEKLVVFGSRKGRRGAELTVMSSVERKMPGTYVDEDKKLRMRFAQPGDGLADGWGFDVFPFADQEELRFAIGREGFCRKKIAKASGCVLEYVGMVAIMAGDREERARCWDYLKWVLKSMKGALPADAVPYKDRDDVTTFPCKSGHGGMSRLYGAGGQMLRSVEEMSGTFCVPVPDPENGPDQEVMLIFSHSEKARKSAYTALEQVLREGTFSGDKSRRDDRRDNHRGEGRNNRNDGAQRERCYDFSVGRCRRGNACRWAHIAPNRDFAPPRDRAPHRDRWERDDQMDERGHGGPSRGGDSRGARDRKPYGKPSEAWGAGARRGHVNSRLEM